jgi:hypothetical protein
LRFNAPAYVVDTGQAALEHAADGFGQAHVGITDHELDASETSLLGDPMKAFQKPSLSLSPTCRPSSSRRPSA